EIGLVAIAAASPRFLCHLLTSYEGKKRRRPHWRERRPVGHAFEFVRIEKKPGWRIPLELFAANLKRSDETTAKLRYLCERLVRLRELRRSLQRCERTVVASGLAFDRDGPEVLFDGHVGVSQKERRRPHLREMTPWLLVVIVAARRRARLGG